MPGLQGPQAGRAIVDSFYAMGVPLEHNLDGIQDRSIIIDDQNARHACPDSSIVKSRVTYCPVEKPEGNALE